MMGIARSEPFVISPNNLFAQADAEFEGAMHFQSLCLLEHDWIVRGTFTAACEAMRTCLTLTFGLHCK